MNPPPEEHPYHPQDAVRLGVIGGAVTGGAGLAAAAIKSAMSPAHLGAFGAFTQFGTTIGLWGTHISGVDTDRCELRC